MEVAVSGVVIKSRKILLVREGDVWKLPGGGREEGESDLVCLAREFGEELSGTEIDVNSFRHYKDFNGISATRKVPITARVYLVDFEGELGRPSAEIDELDFFIYGACCYSGCLSSMTKSILDSLHRDGYF